MEPYGLFYAKDSDVVCVFCFLELLLLFLTLELGLTSRGAWTEPRRGRWQQNPEAALAPPPRALTSVPTGVHTLEASQCGPRPAPSLMEAGAATRTGGDLGGQQASLAWGRQALGTFWAGGGSERGRKAK